MHRHGGATHYFFAHAGSICGVSALAGSDGFAAHRRPASRSVRWKTAFIGNAWFSEAGQVRAEIVGRNTIVSGNVNAVLGANFAITLTGSHALTGANFIL